MGEDVGEPGSLQELVRNLKSKCMLIGDETAIDLSSANSNVQVGFLELDEWSSELAAQLSSRMGVKSGDCVLLLLKDGLHSAAQAVSMLACLKIGAKWVAGKCWSPADVTRLEMVIQDCQPQAVVAVGENDEAEELKLAARLGLFRTVLVNQDGSLCYAEAMMGVSECEPLQQPADAVYIQYTSGSTGREPKGVIGSADGLFNRILWQLKTFPFNPRDKCLKRTPLQFVDSIAEVLTPLLSGVPLWGSLDTNDTFDIVSLMTKAATAQVTRVTLLPSQLCLVMEHVVCWPALSIVFVSGEPIVLETVARFKEWRKDLSTQLVSLYGSTEVAADVAAVKLANGESVLNEMNKVIMMGECREEDKECSVLCMPLGRPIANADVAVVSLRDGTIVKKPFHVGEILVSGPALALGYTQAQSESAFSTWEALGIEGKHGRVYRTGDLGYLGGDGESLFWVGRKDNQVKIRGVRVSLEQVEAEIASQLDIASSTLACSVDTARKLVLILEQNAVSVPDASSIQRLLSSTLLPHYFPSEVLFSAQPLPKTSSGKLSRAGLAALVEQLQVKQQVAPRISDEMDSLRQQPFFDLVCRVLGEVLGRSIGVQDFASTFLFLGGNSLAAVHFARKLSTELKNMADNNQTLKLINVVGELVEDPGKLLGEENLAQLLFGRAPSHGTDPTIAADKKRKAAFEETKSRTKARSCAPPQDGIRWMYELLKCVDASPAISKNTNILVGSHGGDFVCLNIETGALCWDAALQLDGRVHATAVVEEQGLDVLVWVVAYSDSEPTAPYSTLYCIRVADGTILSQEKVPNFLIKAAPSVGEETVWLAAEDCIIGVSKRGGPHKVVRISEENDGALLMSPVVLVQGTSHVLCGTIFGQVLRLDTCSTTNNVNAVAWSEWFAPVYGEIQVVDSKIAVFGAVDGRVHSLCLTSGKSLWDRQLVGPVFGAVRVVGSSMFVGTQGKRAYCLDVNSGDVRWETALDAAVVVQPAVTLSSSPLVVFATTAGTVYHLALESGDVVHAQRLMAEVFSSPQPLPRSDDILIGCRSNHVVRIDKS